MNRLVFSTLMHCILEIKFLKHEIKNGFQIGLNLKIRDHCREQIRLDKRFPPF